MCAQGPVSRVAFRHTGFKDTVNRAVYPGRRTSSALLEVDVINAIKKLFGSGAQRPEHQLARNDLCWCGSGMKYKRCHMDRDMEKDRIKADACRRYS